MYQDYRTMGAPIGCIDPQYWFGGRTSSAKKIGIEIFFAMIFQVKNTIFVTFCEM